MYRVRIIRNSLHIFSVRAAEEIMREDKKEEILKGKTDKLSFTICTVIHEQEAIIYINAQCVIASYYTMSAVGKASFFTPSVFCQH